MNPVENDKMDKAGYDEFYRGKVPELTFVRDIQEYTSNYENVQIAPYYASSSSDLIWWLPD